MLYSKLVENISIFLAKTNRGAIESSYTDLLNDIISNRHYSDSCEDFLDECKNDSFISYSDAELKTIEENNAVSDLSERLSIKIFARFIETTIQTFNDEELLTLIKALREDQFSTLKKITRENANVREVYRACGVCGYKTHIVDDYSIYCNVCCWDLEMEDKDGRYKFNLDASGNEMTMHEGREHFEKYGLAKFRTLRSETMYTLSESMLFDRWLHDLATSRTTIPVFFEYRDLKRLHYASQ